MNSRQERKIIASLNDQRLDVRLGFITKEEWTRRVDAARAQGVTVPTEWV